MRESRTPFLSFLLSIAALCCTTDAASSAASIPESGATRAIGDVPRGSGRVTIEVGGVELEVFTFRPATWSGERLFVVMHGVLRNAADYRDSAMALGCRFDALIAVPRFDVDRFPSRAYQRGGIERPDGSIAPPAEWTFSRVPELATALRQRTGQSGARLWVIGHSAGGQFVARMAAFVDSGAERLVAVNPGSTLFPTRELPYGYGFGGLPDELASDERLRAYLAAPLTLYVGSADDHADAFFDVSRPAMRQGPGRRQRSMAAFEAAKRLATERGWPFAWQLVEVPGAAHESHAMFAHRNCELALFGPHARVGDQLASGAAAPAASAATKAAGETAGAAQPSSNALR